MVMMGSPWSEEAVSRYRQTISPIAQEVGIEAPPELFPAPTVVST